FDFVRKYRKPYLVQARVPLLSHHTSGVRMESYRTEEDLAAHRALDPLPACRPSRPPVLHRALHSGNRRV
ncbi:MAG TPA: hypothetical protein VHC50_10035, partial [Puia sp.]|nr:hypothetical protein [Puia sp.]